MQDNRARAYDPTLGRFISQDPMGFAAGDANLYRMVGNHPSYATDPSGLSEYKNDFIALFRHDKELQDTVKDLMDMGNETGNPSDRNRFWQAHHWYSQEKSMGTWLEKMSACTLFNQKGVNDPKHISAIATPAHQMITDEQKEFWVKVSERYRSNGFKPFRSYDQIVSDLKSLPPETQKQIFTEYRDFVGQQKKNYAGYFFSGNATLQDIDNAQAKTIDSNQAPKHLSGELLEKFKKRQVKYVASFSKVAKQIGRGTRNCADSRTSCEKLVQMA